MGPEIKRAKGHSSLEHPARTLILIPGARAVFMKNPFRFSRHLSEGPQDPSGFSVVPGGPLFQIYRRTCLSGDEPELLQRVVKVITPA